MSEFLYLQIHVLSCLHTEHHAAAVYCTFLKTFQATKLCIASVANLAVYLLDGIINGMYGSLHSAHSHCARPHRDAKCSLLLIWS